MLLEGLQIPVTTPFYPDGRLNLPKLDANVARTSKSSAAGLILLGPTGEPTLLSDEETREVLRVAAQAAATEKVLIAGISRDSVRATLDLADFAAEQAYDTVLVSAPSIFTSEDEAHGREVLTYFQTVADRSPLPVVLLSTISSALSSDMVVELAAHPNIIGLITHRSPAAIAEFLSRTTVVEREVPVTMVFAAVTERMRRAAAQCATRSLVSAASLAGTAIVEAPPAVRPLRTRSKTVGFQILSSSTQSILKALRAGAVGAAPSLAAAAPQACYEVYAAWKDDDQPLAEEKQARLREAAVLAESSVGSLKFACELNGYFGGLPRLPLLPPTGDQRAALKPLLQQLHN
ncbi:MAG: dihydrodipicolinate synthase family protein [Acidobacteriaceae bacterium]|nr:dihydrodipicolinate synthase family protein [Acidobacteriaceae bacterium]